MKKIILIVVAAIILLGAAGYFILFRKPTLFPIPDISTGPRSYLMGFSVLLPPSSNPNTFIPQKLEALSKHADAIIEHPDVPWKELLAGRSPDDLAKNFLQSISQARARKFKVYLMIEPLNGLDRSSEAEPLVSLHRSIAELDAQRVYRDYALAMAKIVKPDALGLAAEVNGFKILGPKASYAGLVKMVNDARQELKKQNPALPLYISVAADVAWAKQSSSIEDIFTDFPSFDLLSFTTYPMTVWNTPEEVPADYLSRLVKGHDIPVIIDESGWPSNFNKKTTSPDMQSRWIKKFSMLADSVTARFIGQLLFNDAEPQLSNPTVEFFTTQGLVDSNLSPKPALTEWDKMFRRQYSAK